MSPTSPGSAPPACTGASPCFPERQAARQAEPSHVQGPPQPIPTSEPMRARRASLHVSGARLRSTDRRHKSPRALQGHPLSNAASRNSSSCHGQAVARPIQRASLPAVLHTSGLLSLTQKSPRPKATLGCGLKKADASSYLSYFAAAWRRAALALMQSTMPTARTPTIAVTQAAKSPKCRAGIPMSRPTT